MAKMNKTEAVNAAKNMARNHVDVTTVTLEQLSTMDYGTRRQLAHQIAMTGPVGRIDTQERYIADCIKEFVQTAMNIWGTKEKDLQRKRDSFKRACSGMTEEAAKNAIVALLQSMNIRGANISEYGPTMEVKRGRCDSRLYIRMRRNDGGVTNPDDSTQRAGTYSVSVEISTSGTTYTLPEMAVMNKINAELLDAANEVQAVIERENIVWTWGLPEVAAVDANVEGGR